MSGTKRKVFFSSPPTSPNGGMPNKVININGYIVAVGVIQVGATGNAYFDVKLKTEQVEYQNVRVMTLGLKGDEFEESLGQAVSLTKVTNSNGTYFYNAQRGSRMEAKAYGLPFDGTLNITNIGDIKEDIASPINVKAKVTWKGESREVADGKVLREAILQDDSGNMQLTVWKDINIALIKDSATYLITDCILKDYYGLKLSTTWQSVIQEIEELKDLTKLELPEEHQSNLTVIEGNPITVEITSTKRCFKCHSLVAKTNDTFVRCTSCNKRQCVSVLVTEIEAEVDVQTFDKVVTIHFTGKELKGLFDDISVVEKLEEDILMLGTVKFNIENNKLVCITRV